MNHFSLKNTYQYYREMIPLVSIVVVCLNEESRISGCLNSLLCQEFPKNLYEILVIDGGSIDKTRDIVKQFPVALITDNYGTLGHQRNIGVRASKGNCNAIYRRDLLLENPYDDSLTWGEDADLNYRLRKKGYKILYCSQAVVRHYRITSIIEHIKKMGLPRPSEFVHGKSERPNSLPNFPKRGQSLIALKALVN